MTRWLRGATWLVLVGVIWSAAAHPCAAFPDVKGIVALTANQNPLENLIPLIVKGISEEHRNLRLQNQVALPIVPHLFVVQSDVKLVRERVVGSEECGKPGVIALSACP